MSSRVPRSREDLEQSFEEQVGFLRKSTKLYDEGDFSEAKRLAGTLRQLLHDTSQSKSVLGQLGYSFLQFHDSAGEINPQNLLTECPLVMMQLGGNGPDYLPLLDNGPFSSTTKPFVRWWKQDVFRDNARQLFSRKDITLSVADTDGGSHVDPSLPDGYHRLSRENSLAWIVGSPSGQRPAQNPVPAAIRQIAHETLKSLAPALVKLR